jgi:superfamily II DNA or RNA helicase
MARPVETASRVRTTARGQRSPVQAPVRTYGAIALVKKAVRNKAGQPNQAVWRLTDIEPHVAIKLKAIFLRVPKQSPGPFELPHDRPTDTDLDWFLMRYPLAISPEDREAMTEGVADHVSVQANLERILLPDYRTQDFLGLQPGQQVRHYQAQAIDLAYSGDGLLLGDECGLGKTYTACGFCLRPGVLPAAIVCQVHIQKQWADVFKAFTNLRVHAVNKASPYDLPDADVYLFRYSQIGGWVDVFQKGLFKSVVYDEPQELRGGLSTARGEGARALSGEARWRLGLTATPIYNYGFEIFNIMQFIRPGVFGPWDDFSREYLADGKRLRNPKALGTYLREQHAFLRRTKKDVGKEMPPVNRIVDTIDTDADAVQSIEETARALAVRAVTGAFTERGSAARELDMLVRQATGVAKARAVARIVRILVESDTPVVLFGWHRAVYDIWLKELGDLNPAMYTGSESGAEKNRSKENFLAGRTNLLIMSLRSAAGLDGLQARCSTAVFGELDWSPGVHHQCIERLDREGQPDTVTALFLVCDEGSDPPIMEILGLKASEARQVVDPVGGMELVNTDGSRIQSLVDRYLVRAGRRRHEAQETTNLNKDDLCNPDFLAELEAA